jgi:lipopolysaccharide/colanic/teichoic acid biosynthesis glycosyltransferase
MYLHFFKRLFDIILSFLALIILSPIFLILIILGAIVMKGNPFFIQIRPGRISKKTGRERLFRMIKLRSMTNARDPLTGELLPDELRLTGYGRFLRSTSIDELPEILNVLIGDMSLVGPRPQLVRDMVFMSEEQRMRHTVRPGITGLAQVSGRNNIGWNEKFELDLKYVSRVTLFGDIKILFKTVGKVLRRADTVREGTASDLDFGDWLMKEGLVDEQTYGEKQEEAKELLKV